MNLGAAVRFNKCGVGLLCLGVVLLLIYTFGGNRNSYTNNTEDNLLFNAFIHSKGFYSSSEKVTLKALLAAAIDVAKRGGAEVVSVRKTAADLTETVKGKTKEGVKDSATEGDFRSHKVMFYGFRKSFPKVKVISEEHTEVPTSLADVVPASISADAEVLLHMPGDDTLDADDVVVWIDPLDATKEYTENLVEYVTTMVGIAVKGKPIIGVIYRPFTDEVFWGVVGHGNSPNLDARSKDKAESLRIIVSRSHAGNVANFTKTALAKENVEIIPAAGAGYKVIEVIHNKADVYAHVTAIKKWDLCAGHAIITALGGFMTTVNDEPIDFSWHTDPLNTKGILAYMHLNPSIKKLQTIQIHE